MKQGDDEEASSRGREEGGQAGLRVGEDKGQRAWPGVRTVFRKALWVVGVGMWVNVLVAGQ